MYVMVHESTQAEWFSQGYPTLEECEERMQRLFESGQSSLIRNWIDSFWGGVRERVSPVWGPAGEILEN